MKIIHVAGEGALVALYYRALRHIVSRYVQETEPREAGVLDMNRYENL
ncbi:hypothetical protein [Pseudomonas syringae]|nr:hypothetical protein [Pseudomonas syringae]KOG02396.1 Unknown protein sequence [Pseudomonas syringae pv. aceris]MCH5553798.1 hypothetical protein [Pseudomonas syringae pv. syringae]MCH5573807.1 hypothetical protein [Pseudomonas syringae pv. syringae]MCH5666179.1 hypothetical protein [Pseudomonas syringae pv. syringae]